MNDFEITYIKELEQELNIQSEEINLSEIVYLNSWLYNRQLIRYSLNTKGKVVGLNLDYLILSDKIISIMQEFCSLKSLSIVRTGITQSSFLQQYENLEVLNISFNEQLPDLVQSIQPLIGLRKLYIAGNDLSEMVFEKENDIVELDISLNEFKSLIFLLDMPKLETLHFDKNPIAIPPSQILSAGLIKIKEYLANNKNKLIISNSVFISYNHIDQEVAFKIKSQLEEAGILVIIDAEAMKTGEDIAEFIKNGIKQSAITLSLVSSKSLLSSWVAMETIWSNYDETLRSRFFMPCYLDSDFFERSFTGKALIKIGEEIKEINSIMLERLEKDQSIEDLQAERTRYKKLENELPSIIGKLKSSLCVDISENNFEKGIRKVIQYIKDFQGVNNCNQVNSD